MSVDQLEREQQHLPPVVLARPYTPEWAPRILPLAITLAVSLAMWAGIILLVRWALHAF